MGNPLTATKMKLEHQFIPDAYKTFQNAKFMTIKHNLQVSDKPVVTAPISHRRGDRHGKYGFRTSQQKWLETPSHTYRSVNRKKHSVDAHMHMRFPNIKSVAQTPVTNTKSSATGNLTQENERVKYPNTNPLKHNKINLKHRWKTPHLRDLASNSSVQQSSVVASMYTQRHQSGEPIAVTNNADLKLQESMHSEHKSKVKHEFNLQFAHQPDSNQFSDQTIRLEQALKYDGTKSGHEK